MENFTGGCFTFIRVHSWLKFFCSVQLVPSRGYDKLMSMKFNSAAVAVLLLFALAARGQPTAFTYQGQLNSSNAPANGVYDFQFQIYNASSIVVAGPLTNAPVTVSNGLFTVALDFGGGVFNGNALTLEIGVRTNGSTGAYAILSPRQPILSVPYAVQSLNASNLSSPLQATNITGTISDTRLSANVALLNGNQTFSGANLFNNAANNFTGAFSGNGIGQTNLSATNLVGTLPDARLSTNVALLNSNLVFSGTDKFTGAVTATNTANVFAGAFSGNGLGQTNLSATNLVGTLPDARLSTNVALLNASQNFGGAITATNPANVFTGAYSGSGHGLTNVPGAFFWVTVSGTNVQANPNTGYITTNNVSPVEIALPAAPSIGDVYKVAGVGAAGWIITQTNNQTIIAGNLSGSVGQSWKAVEGSANWSAIASSSDGTKLVAVVNNGYIYTSTNSGANWTQQNNSGSRYWSSVASSADGTKLVAAVGYTIYTASQPGAIYTSTDSGVTWTPHTSSPLSSSLDWSSVASSADGSKLVAAVRDGTGQGIYISSNSGGSWSSVSGSSGYLWTCVASSSDGSKLVAAETSADQIYTSTNYGANWTSHGISGSPSWTAAASSADGSRLITTTASGAVYVSTDSGATWVKENSNTSSQLTSVTSSSDGSRLATTGGGASSSGNIFASSDSGSTWTQLNGALSASWSSIASSADGSSLAATVYGGDIYVSSQSSTTTGTAGYLTGAQHTAIELEYVGNGIFLPLSHEGTLRAY
jgi:hypothetical protein